MRTKASNYIRELFLNSAGTEPVKMCSSLCYAIANKKKERETKSLYAALNMPQEETLEISAISAFLNIHIRPTFLQAERNAFQRVA